MKEEYPFKNYDKAVFLKCLMVYGLFRTIKLWFMVRIMKDGFTEGLLDNKFISKAEYKRLKKWNERE